MKFTPSDPPRRFTVGVAEVLQISDTAHVQLDENEQITLVTNEGREFDIVRKSWGYYATPSLNGRLKDFGLRALLVKSPSGFFFVLMIEQGKEKEAHRYLDIENQQIICWLDTDEALARIERALAGEAPDA